jgi:hypothetical protein
MIRLKRRNMAWLTIIAILTGIAVLSATVAPEVEVALLGIFALSALASFIEFSRQGLGLLDVLQRAPSRMRASPQAREASERARRRGGYVDPGLALVDVGLIVLQSGHDGMVMRRARSISKDDDGARPFLVLNVAPEDADRNATIRFEIIDQHGKEQFVHEMKSYLRDGEMNVLADHHLPMGGNDQIAGSGDWDLRVTIDGNLVALHNFTLAPSYSERRRRITPDEEYATSETQDFIEAEEELPLSLEELLRDQQRSSRQ